MSRYSLDADNSNQFFKIDHMDEYYRKLQILFSSCFKYNLRYDDVKRLLYELFPLSDSINDDDYSKRISDELSTTFQHCFFRSQIDARCTATLMLTAKALFRNIKALKRISVLMVDDDKINVFMNKYYMSNKMIDEAQIVIKQSILVFGVISCVPTVREHDYEIYKAMCKIITYCETELINNENIFTQDMNAINKQKYIHIKMN